VCRDCRVCREVCVCRKVKVDDTGMLAVSVGKRREADEVCVVICRVSRNVMCGVCVS